jgi:RsiW-degrading membrane proteinase PrsW (M82 family)
VSYVYYIFFALAPSAIWLLYFLRKDTHPESKKMVLNVFFLGVIIAIPTALFEMGILDIIQNLPISPLFVSVISTFLGIAFVEEAAKYLVVKFKIVKSSEMDEPFDLVMYMIIAALGFAVTENILILTGAPSFELADTATISAFRFIGATFLHALCSAALGFFIALSFCFIKNRVKYLLSGFAIVIFLHGIYNLSIMNIDGNEKFIMPVIILVSLALFVHWGLHKLGKIKSVCKIK